MTELRGVQVWDGYRHRGRGTVSWRPVEDGEGPGPDAVLETVDVTPGPSGASRRGGDVTGDDELCVIPGLIDTHVHLLGYAGTSAVDFYSWPVLTRADEQVLHGLAHAQRALAGGVTTLRDLGAGTTQVSLAGAIAAGVVTGPRVFTHGMVGMTAGHFDMFTPRTVTDRYPTADGADACRALVRRWAREGMNGVKIATSGGVLSSGDKASWRNHTAAEIEAIVDEARALGLPVAAHAHTVEGIDVAIRAGVDSVEHATQLSAEQAERVASAGIVVGPTLLINEAIAEQRVPVPAAAAAKARDLVARRDELFARAAGLGVDFVLATDANGYHVRFGDQMREVVRMAEVFGWSAERALQAATSRAAASLRRTGTLGVLAPGARADLVVLRGRPWERLEDLRVENIVAVIAAGRLVHGSLPPVP